VIVFLLLASWQATLKIGGGTITIDANGNIPRAPTLAWIERSAETVALYYGHFPVTAVAIHLQTNSRRLSGTTFGDPARIEVSLAEDTLREALDEDWVLVHEMIHLALPSLRHAHAWLEEGISTFVEPLARARAGHRRPELVWKEWITRMPQGEPALGDQGLDHTHTWARTYWGGALFCLVAEARLRVATHGEMGLETALRGVLAAGGSVNVEWPVAQVIAAGDAATGLRVLRTLYDEMKDAPAPVDLPALWAALGVSLHGDEVVYDNTAKWAKERKAILE
jgi:hypothetical protein